jgi:hypothetical protein
MTQLSAMHLMGLTFLLACLSAMATSLTIEQQLEELKEYYVNMNLVKFRINLFVNETFLKISIFFSLKKGKSTECTGTAECKALNIMLLFLATI